LPDGTPQIVGELPEGWPRSGSIITCDGRTVISSVFEVDQSKEYPLPTTMDPELLWQWAARPRCGSLQAYDLGTGEENTVIALKGLLPIHADASPTDPTLLKFSHDDYDAFCQRIWTVRTNGSGLTKIRPQERGELVTHEFWWPDGQYIGYKYQDRRHDATIHDLPWAEYSPIPTQFGLANLAGEEFYLSDPLNHYHTHINVSPDGRTLSGEGTDGHLFVYAAAFSPQSTRIDFIPHATVHTPYVPFRANQVNASFSADGEWIIFNDRIDGKSQVCAVKVEV
jgi:oligogalacturonide lyase